MLRANPRNVEALGNMGVACMMSGRSMEAMQYFEKTLETGNRPSVACQNRKMDREIAPGSECPQDRAACSQEPAGPVKSLW